MILSTLENSKQIESLHPKFKLLFDYIKKTDLLNRETGRIEIDGDNLFINNVCSDMIAAREQSLEAHRVYIDVHFPLDKTEIMAWKPLLKCTNIKSNYNENNDCELYSDIEENLITVMPGEFIIFFPEDAHGPLIGDGKIRKIIAKVKIDSI